MNVKDHNSHIKNDFNDDEYQTSNYHLKKVDKKDKKLDSSHKTKRRSPFSSKEDELLLELVHKYDIRDKNNWNTIASQMKGRNSRQCRERYRLFLSDDVKRKKKWTTEEDELLRSKYTTLGPKWKMMEKYFNGITYVSIKNRFKLLSRQKAKENEIKKYIHTEELSRNDTTSNITCESEIKNEVIREDKGNELCPTKVLHFNNNETADNFDENNYFEIFNEFIFEPVFF